MKLQKLALKLSLLSMSLVMIAVGGCSKKSEAPQSQPLPGNVVASIVVSNPSEFARVDEPVYFSYYSLGLAAGDSRMGQLVAKSGDAVLPSQPIDKNGDGADDGLLAMLNMQAASESTIEVMVDPEAASQPLTKRTQAEISRKTGGEWVDRKYQGGQFENVQSLTPPPQHTDHSQFIRYEGPGIESDKVGYRVYLDWRNGFDIFGKKTNDMVLQNVGQDGFESYHQMADWGMDLLKVGDALGVGGYGFWNGEKVERVSKVDGWDTVIVENGDIYSAFQTTYKGWEVASKKVNLTAMLSMTAGSRLVHVKLKSDLELPNIATGIVKHKGTEFIQGELKNITGEAWTYIASYGKQSLSGETDNLGMAILFKRGDLDAQKETDLNYVAIMEPNGNNFLEYYFLAAWDGEPNGIANQEAFIAYLEQEAERLTLTPRVRMTTALNQEAKNFPVSAEDALNWSKKMANSELSRGATYSYIYGGIDIMRQRPSTFEYTTGLLLQAYDDLAMTGNPQYADHAYKIVDSFITDEGNILTYKESNYNIDSINTGKMVLRLYENTKEEKYKIAAGHLRQQLENHPRTSEGAFWHKKRYPYQLWLDGVYMGMPFLTHYSALFEDGAHMDEAVNEFVIARKYLRDPKTGLYFHAWDEKKQQDWADKETGLSKHFWSRGSGWYAMALVDVLDFIPEDNQELRKPLLDMIPEFADAIIKYQDEETGVWYQVLDQPDRAGNYREASGSSMYAYFLTKAINKGYLPGSYKKAAIKAYEGVVREFVTVHADGTISLTNNCSVAGLGFGRDGSYHYYMSEPIVDNDPKGVGPFIMAGVQLSNMLN